MLGAVDHRPQPQGIGNPAAILDALVADYAADRAEIDALHPPVADPLVCRYCGKHRRPWFGCKLPGHAKCMVSPAFRKRLCAVFSTVNTYMVVAETLGVSASVVRAWWRLGREKDPR